MTRTVLETVRTLFVWLADLALFYSPWGGNGKLGESWDRYSWLQVRPTFDLGIDFIFLTLLSVNEIKNGYPQMKIIMCLGFIMTYWILTGMTSHQNSWRPLCRPGAHQCHQVSTAMKLSLKV